MKAGSRSGPRWALAYLRERLSPTRLLLPLCVAFLCAWSIFAPGTGDGWQSWLALARGAATFVLLLAQLRVVDDLDDLGADYPSARPDAIALREELRARLKLVLAAVAVALLLMNLSSPRALAAVAAATVLAYAGPFAVKRWCPPRAPFLVLAFVVFEGAPAAAFAYAYYGAGQLPRVGGALGVALTSALWLAYEFWKFSRKVHRDTFQPYFLERAGVRVSLSVMLLLASGVNAAAARLAQLGSVALSYLALLPLVLFCWMNARWLVDASRGSAGRWAGMTYLVLLEVGLLFGLLTGQGAG